MKNSQTEKLSQVVDEVIAKLIWHRELCRFPDSPGAINVLVLFAEDQVI